MSSGSRPTNLRTGVLGERDVHRPPPPPRPIEMTELGQLPLDPRTTNPNAAQSVQGETPRRPENFE